MYINRESLEIFGNNCHRYANKKKFTITIL